MIWIATLASGVVFGSSASLPQPVTHLVAFRVTGVVTSSRDGSPVAHCRVTLSPADSDSRAPEQDIAGSDFFSPERFSGQPGRGRRGPGFEPARASREDESVLTDARGRFTLAAAHSGAWFLSGIARGFRMQRYDQHGQFSTRLILSARYPEIKVDMVLRPKSVLSGRVLDEFGEAVTVAQVTAQRKVVPIAPDEQARWQTAGMTQTDDRGHYELTNLDEGEYRVSVSARPWYASGFIPRFVQGSVPSQAIEGTSQALDPSLDKVFPVTWYPGSTDERTAAVLKLTAGDDRQADLQLQSIEAIHLSIPRSPQSPVQEVNTGGRRLGGSTAPQVLRQDEAGGGFGIGQFPTIAQDGSWQIGGLIPGTYEVRVPDSSPGGRRMVQVTLGTGVSTTDLSTATAMIPLSLQIEGADETEMRSLSLTKIDTGQRFTTARHFRAGQFRSTNEFSGSAAKLLEVLPGKYYVDVQLSTGSSLTAIRTEGATISGRVLNISGTSPVLTLVLQQGRSKVVGFTSVAGKPDPGAMVLLVPASYGAAGDLTEVRRDQSASDGSFLFTAIPPGPYLLVAVTRGWVTKWQDPAILAEFLAHGVPLVVPASGQTDQDLESLQP